MKKFALIQILILLFISNTYGRLPIEQTNQIWHSNEFEFRLIDNFRFEAANSLRMDLTNSNIANSFIQFGIGYKFLDYFSISGVLRLKHSEPEWLSEYFTNLNTNFPFGDFKIKTRTRYQNKDNIYRLEELFRQRLMLEYQLNKDFSFAGSGEIFYEINRDFIDRTRYRLDVNHRISKWNEITIGYLFETQHNRKTPKNRDVLFFKLSVRVF